MDSALGSHNPLADVAFPFGVVTELPQHPKTTLLPGCLIGSSSGLTFHTTQEFSCTLLSPFICAQDTNEYCTFSSVKKRWNLKGLRERIPYHCMLLGCSLTMLLCTGKTVLERSIHEVGLCVFQLMPVFQESSISEAATTLCLGLLLCHQYC